MKKICYFDHAATTPCSAGAADRLRTYTEEVFGNPSSTHQLGQKAGRAIEEARQFFADHFKIPPQQIVFTGSGTESDNLAIQGVFMKTLTSQTRTPAVGSAEAPTILFSALEHPAVAKTAAAASALGFNVLEIPVDNTGQVSESGLLDRLTPNTVLVSILQVSNIVGAIQPVEKLARLCKEKIPHVIFHTDAIQAFGRIPVPKNPSAIDLLSISGHKIGGPKGIGALAILSPALARDGLRPVIFGGDQEQGLRSGTPNAGLIAAFHTAARETLEKAEENMAKVEALRKQFSTGIQSRELPILSNSPENFASAVPHILNITVSNCPAGPLVRLLEEENCIVSTGSACHSGKEKPEPALLAMGYSEERARNSIRISFSPLNQPEEIELLLNALQTSIHRIALLQGPSARNNRHNRK